MEIKVSDLVGTRALTLEDGDLLHALVVERLKAGETITVDFAGVSDISTAFLNTAIGQLYAEFPQVVLRTSLQFVELNDSGQRSLEKVLTYARRFYDVNNIQEA